MAPKRTFHAIRFRPVCPIILFLCRECKPRFRHTGVMAPERPGRHPEETAANRTGGTPAVNGTAECAEKAISTVLTAFPFAVSKCKATGI